MKEDKLDIFTSAKLEETHKVVKDNGRSIADNSIKLDLLSDNVKDTKELVKSIQSKLDILLEMQEKSLTKQELIHIRSLDTEELMKEVLKNQEVLRRDLDRLYQKWDWADRKVGVV